MCLNDRTAHAFMMYDVWLEQVVVRSKPHFQTLTDAPFVRGHKRENVSVDWKWNGGNYLTFKLFS